MTLGSHQRTVGSSQTYITPRSIIDDLGPFDTDPCAASNMPWATAHKMVTEAEDGLSRPWSGFVWCNPPFDRKIVGAWVRRMAEHRNGILLVHARTETGWFQPVWASDAVLFLRGRVTFCREDGSRHAANSGAPVILAAWGQTGVRRLRTSSLGGHLVTP